jgi:hypothetical protein
MKGQHKPRKLTRYWMVTTKMPCETKLLEMLAYPLNGHENENELIIIGQIGDILLIIFPYFFYQIQICPKQKSNQK